MRSIVLFGGNSNPKLLEKIAADLQIPLGKATVNQFSDGEIRVEIAENVRGRDVFIVQSICAPTNDNLMELMLLADAVRRASAFRITAVIPYLGYARQDRRARSARVPISVKVVADMLSSVLDRVLTVDLHADQIEGFLSIPVDHAYGSSVLIHEIAKQNYGPLTVVSPDVGGVVRARAFSKRLVDSELAIIDKRRPQPNQAQVMNIIGEIRGRDCILVDDMLDTGGTLCMAAKALKEQGAARVDAYCTHAVFSGAAVQNIIDSPFDKVFVTDTIPLKPEALACKKIHQLSLAKMLSEAIRRVSDEESVSSMFSI